MLFIYTIDITYFRTASNKGTNVTELDIYPLGHIYCPSCSVNRELSCIRLLCPLASDWVQSKWKTRDEDDRGQRGWESCSPGPSPAELCCLAVSSTKGPSSWQVALPTQPSLALVSGGEAAQLLPVPSWLSAFQPSLSLSPCYILLDLS